MHRRPPLWLLLVAGAALLPACSSKQDERDLIPSEAKARQALQTALDAWKGGQPKPGRLSMGKVGVEVVDAGWQSGQKLTGYEVLSEEGGTDGPRRFSVKLTLAMGAQTVTYVVLGNDPVWVYTEAEYKKLSGS